MLFWLLASYGVIGMVVALAFAARGAGRLLPQSAPISAGARLLLVPGAFLLWPYLVIRWLRSGGPR